MGDLISQGIIRINGEPFGKGTPRITSGTRADAYANAKRMADAIAPVNPEHAIRCNCRPCVRNRQHLWAILRAVYRWSLHRTAALLQHHHSTVHHGVAVVAGMAHGFKNRAYVRAVPGKRMRNYVRKTRLQTVAQRRKEWGSKEMRT